MSGVVSAAVLGPVSAVYVLGPVAGVLMLPTIGLGLGVNVGWMVQPGLYTTPDKITTSITAAFVVAYFALLLYMSFFNKIECFFSYTPWLRHQGEVKAPGSDRTYATRCPFTGQRPTMRCPSCACRVHHSAFHQDDPYVKIPLGETVLRWDTAKLATEMLGPVDKVRRELDTALDFRGNTLFCTTKGCCTGCAHWMRNFNLIPRLSMSLVMAGLFCAFLPWALASFLSGGDTSANTQQARSLIGGGGAKTVHICCNLLALLYTQSGVLFQVQALLRANNFLTIYRPSIPSLKPLFRQPQNFVARALLKAPWHQAV